LNNNSLRRFRVVHFSSEDPDFPASQLNTVHPTTKGWQSVRFASYPQELGFEMLDGYVNIHQIQVLNHQANISSKIEIYIGTGDTYDTATWKRLGYMSIDSNEKSNYQARELKTVFVDSFGQYLKLILNENHHNHLNIFNQVGIIALNLTGVPAQESKSVPHQPVAKVNPSKPPSKNVYTDLSADLNLDPQTAGKLRQLAEAKGRAIDNEDYLTAKQIKSVEQELKALGSRLAQLDLAKAEAVASEDYDLAKEIKDQCDDLRKEIDRKIRAIEIPGVRLTTPQAPAQPKTHGKPPRFSKDENDSYDDEIVVQKKVMNVDDIVVGGGGGGGTSGKKVAKVESFHMSSFDDNIGHPSGGGDDHYYDEPMQNDDTQGDDRPIKPKSNMDYNDRDPTVETNDDGMNTGMPTEKFPVGEHPLEGIPGFLDLPTPEQLTIKSR
jgi:centrosomal protein CEP104